MNEWVGVLAGKTRIVAHRCQTGHEITDLQLAVRAWLERSATM